MKRAWVTALIRLRRTVPVTGLAGLILAALSGGLGDERGMGWGEVEKERLAYLLDLESTMRQIRPAGTAGR